MTYREEIAELKKAIGILVERDKERDTPPPEPTERQLRDAAIERAHQARKEAARVENIARRAPYKPVDPTPRNETAATQSRVSVLPPPPQLSEPRRTPPRQIEPLVYQSYNGPWKVTASNDISGNPVLNAVKVMGGDVFTQGSFSPGAITTVATLDPLGVSSTGDVVLRVTREPATRAIIYAAIEWHAAAPDSAQDLQYIVLASVIVDGAGVVTDIAQKQYGEICIFEDMVVVNGEFQLVQLAIRGRNHYALPTP